MLSPLSFLRDKSLVSADGVKEALDKKSAVTIVDVRTPEEYAEGHIAGSVLVPVQTLQEELGKLPQKDATLFVYCRRGIRGAKAVDLLKKSGYTNVHNMTGGIEVWTAKNYPLEKKSEK